MINVEELKSELKTEVKRLYDIMDSFGENLQIRTFYKVLNGLEEVRNRINDVWDESDAELKDMMLAACLFTDGLWKMPMLDAPANLKSTLHTMLDVKSSIITF